LVGQEFVCFHQAAKVNELGKGEIGRKRAARKFFTLLSKFFYNN